MRGGNLHTRILLGLVLGVAIGLPLNFLAEAGRLDPAVPRRAAAIGNEVGTLFLRLLQMVVVPLIMTSLISGVTSIGDLRRLGRVGRITFAFFAISALLALVVGLILVNVIRPGDGVDLAALNEGAGPAPTTAPVAGDTAWQIAWNQIVGMIPRNPIAAAAAGDMLPIIFFSLFTGVFISLTGSRARDTLTAFFSAAFEVMMRMTMFVIELAPLGVLGFMVYATAGLGLSVFAALGWYMLTVASGLAFHLFVTLPLLLRLVARRSPVAFFRAMSPMILTAFSTASSNATLPVTMNCVEQRAGIGNRISSFVLPLGATVNMNGSALYECVAVLFMAQAYGYSLGFEKQLIVAFTALLVSIGAAGIPHAGTVLMFIVCNAAGIPADAVGLILAVDRVLDMSRTVVNVFSDTVVCAVVARYDPELAAAPAPS